MKKTIPGYKCFSTIMSRDGKITIPKRLLDKIVSDKNNPVINFIMDEKGVHLEAPKPSRKEN